MSQVVCPVCGEPLKSAVAGSCAECGALLTDEILQNARAAAAQIPKPQPAEPAPEPTETEELIEAFRAQFERHQIYLPRSWTKRLERLAAEAETSRRQAMVFFVDLRGYTALAQKLSEKQLDSLLQWFYGLCTRHVERHGGFVIQLVGDAVFAAFGAPWAFERDAESGLRAVLEIRDEVRAKGNFEGYPLAVRAGADCGTVNVRLDTIHGQRRPDLVGSTVNLAARLQAAAETWEILVSDTLADQVRGIFNMEARPPFVPKNFHREVQPWSVTGHRLQDAVRRRQDLRFVGRVEELNRLLAAIDETSRGGCRMISLSGEAGVGKTRLVREAFSRVDPARIATVSVDCEPHYRYALLQTMLDLIAALTRPGEPSSDPAARLAAVAALCSELDPAVLPSIGYVLGVEPHAGALRALPGPQLRRQIVASLAALIKAAAHAKPLVLFIDDAQWIDRVSWEVFERLFEERPAGLMLIVTARPQPESNLPDDFNVALLLEEGPLEKMTLRALPDPELRELLNQILDLDRLHPLVRRRLLSETEGIPLYLIELARCIEEQQQLPLAEALAHDHPGGPTPHIPPVVIEVMQARIDNLQAQRRAILQCGAALGRRFSQRLIQVFESIYPALLAELFALKGMQMLEDQPLPNDIEYFFTPTLLRDVAYHMMTADQQVRLHRRVAELIEEFFPERADQFAFELAVHWMRAGDMQRARCFLRRASRQSIGRGAPQEAYELVLQALESFADGQPIPSGPLSPQMLLDVQQRGIIEQLAGQAGRMLGQYSESDIHFQKFLEIARVIGNEQWLARAHFELAGNAVERGEMDKASGLLDLIGDANPGSPLHNVTHNLRGMIKLRTGKVDGAIEEFRAIAELMQEESGSVADAWNNMGLVFWMQGRLQESEASFGRALDIWRRIGQPFGEVATESNLGIIAEKQGRHGLAERHYARALETAESIGYLHGISAIEANLANLALLRRDFEEARHRSARSLQSARMIGHRNSEAIALENLGLAFGAQGLFDEALASLAEAEGVSEKTGDPERRDSARLARAWIALLNRKWDLCRSTVETLPDEIGADLRSWRESMLLALDLVGGNRAPSSDDLDRLDDLQKTASTEDYLRHIDALTAASASAGANDLVTTLHQRRADAMDIAAVGGM
ncbi:AAA family ATPase [bacterium]|nr:AAA family ATPase [bacterium]